MPMRQLTTAAHGHVLTNCGVWSPDSRWIAYDIRSAADGGAFDGTRIERVEVDTGRVEVLHESRQGACCGVVTCSPVDDRVAFILGPEHPSSDWSYGPARRQGVLVRASCPGVVENLDARDLVPPFTSGALRGGSHVHVFSPDGAVVSFTYEDAVLVAANRAGLPGEHNRRGIAVSVCGRPVIVPRTHPRNHDGSAFSVMVSRLHDDPRAGTDDIARGCEEAWIGVNGYRRHDGSWQRRALAFQGDVSIGSGETISEVFVVDLPDKIHDLEKAGEGPLTGTATTRPLPPLGVRQRRLTFSAGRLHPGIQGPRHWLRSSPDGERIGFLMRDEAGIAQIHTVSPRGGQPVQVTRGPHGIASAFTWSPCGGWIACVIDGSVCLVDAASGTIQRLTPPVRDASGPRSEACVFSPNGRRVAFVRNLLGDRETAWNQIFTVDVHGRS
ncbi:MAG: DUF3748 domain-containing protein [Planctomycetia bacterium]|nr:DUF3748 domain-containing protein [Planctomycetia bacterium]